jgi:hypothetical protein
MAFIPVFFFASLYGQIALGEKATNASVLLLYFFLGFVVAAQTGGRMLDRIGVKRPVVLGRALAAVGFGLWASKATTLHTGQRQRRRDPRVHPRRLRRRRPVRAVHDGPDHGRGGRGGPVRSGSGGGFQEDTEAPETEPARRQRARDASPGPA